MTDTKLLYYVLGLEPSAPHPQQRTCCVTCDDPWQNCSKGGIIRQKYQIFHTGGRRKPIPGNRGATKYLTIRHALLSWSVDSGNLSTCVCVWKNGSGKKKSTHIQLGWWTAYTHVGSFHGLGRRSLPFGASSKLESRIRSKLISANTTYQLIKTFSRCGIPTHHVGAQ